MIADMKKLLLFGNNSEKSKLLKILHEMGSVEVSLARKLDDTQYIANDLQVNEVTKKITQLDFCFNYFKTNRREADKLVKDKKLEYTPFKDGGLLTPRPSLTFEEFSKSDDYYEEVFKVVKEIEDINIESLKIKSDLQKAQNIIKQLQPYKNIDEKFSSIKDTKHVSMMLGSINTNKLSLVSQLEEKGAVVNIYPNHSNCTIFVAIVKSEYESIVDILTEMEFSNCTLNYNDTACSMIEDNTRRIKELDDKRIELIKKTLTLEPITPKAKVLYDYYLLEAKKLECETFTSSTQTSYLLEAWIPSTKADELDKKLEESPLVLTYVIREPLEGEEPPTLAENNKLATPYESVTNMFSAPKYKEIDPNPFVAFFFFLFFGMMLSDAGYGLILTIIGIVFLACAKPPKGQSNLVKIILMGGISTIAWGIVFGSYFGVSAGDLGIWYWFNPIEDPMMMMYLSLGMGIFQMFFGIGIHIYDLCKHGQVFEGITNTCWYFLVLGIAGFAVGGKTMIGISFGAWVKTVGIVLLIIGFLFLLISGTFGKKGAKKVTGALSNVYGIINFFSDLMSYTRIFGLGLATAVIGMVFNNISSVIMSLIPIKAIGVVAAIIILLIGHTFNVAINALGAYVHNSRLQFVEFFGKFYTGGGRLFKPLGSEMKYYYIKPQEVKK